MDFADWKVATRLNTGFGALLMCEGADWSEF